MNFACVAYTIYEHDYRVRRYAEALKNSENRVDAFALRVKGKEGEHELSGVNICHIRERGFQERKRLDYLFGILGFFIKGSIVLALKQLKHRYKLIHIHSVPDFLVFMGVVPKLLGARVILDIHDILPEFYCQKFGKKWDSLFAKALLLVEKASVRFADHVIVANDLWRQKIVARTGIPEEKCTALLNYPNISFFKKRKEPSSARDSFRIIYPGHLSYHHGVDIALRALEIVRKKVPGVRLDIYASSWVGDYKQDLERQVSEAGLDGCVTFHEGVRVEKLGDIYQGVDLGIVTKRPGVFTSEAFSTKILDFMAAGIPIVASKTTIDEFYFDDSAMVFFEPENARDMAEKIVDLYEHPDKRRPLVENGLRFVSKNNWAIKSRLYLEIVNALVETGT